jgi:hypothetical protein
VHFDTSVLVIAESPFSLNRYSPRVDHTPEHSLSRGNIHNRSSALDKISFFYSGLFLAINTCKKVQGRDIKFENIQFLFITNTKYNFDLFLHIQSFIFGRNEDQTFSYNKKQAKQIKTL